MVSPDEGSAKRCTSVANDLNLEFALINNRKDAHKKHKYRQKQRTRNVSTLSTASRDPHSQSEREAESETNDESSVKLEKMTNLAVTMSRSHRKISLSGSVTGRMVIIVDDMIDTGRTIREAIDVSIVCCPCP